MFGENTITGPGYTARVPPDFTFAGGMPAMGVYHFVPPGSGMFIEAALQIRSVQAFELQGLLQNMCTFENPMVAQQNATNLGLSWVIGVLPMRTVPMPQGQTSIREFDAMNPRGIPVRVMVLVMRGPQSAVEVVIVMNLYRWTEFVGPCLNFVGQISLQGVAQQSGHLQAVVDQNRTDQVEYQFVTPDHSPVPLTALPTIVAGTVIIHMESAVNNGQINGTSVSLGTHSTATVQNSDAAPAT